MTRIDRRQREFEHRERDILDAALALFSGPGWETVSVAQIAARAEIGKGTLYKHFKSKDELLVRLMLRFYAGLLERLRQQPPAADVVHGFRRSFEYALRYHLERREYRYVVEYCNRIDFKERAEPQWRAAFLDMDQAFGAWSAPQLLAAMEAGVIERRPLKTVQLGLHACFDGAVAMLWAGADWCPFGDEPAIVEAVTDFALAALVGRVSGAPAAPPGTAAAIQTSARHT